MGACPPFSVGGQNPPFSNCQLEPQPAGLTPFTPTNPSPALSPSLLQDSPLKDPSRLGKRGGAQLFLVRSPAVTESRLPSLGSLLLGFCIFNSSIQKGAEVDSGFS